MTDPAAELAREIAEHAAYRGFAVDVLAGRIAEAFRSFGAACYRRLSQEGRP